MLLTISGRSSLKYIQRSSSFTDRGYHLSFTGIATYPKADEPRRTIQLCPLEQLMIETDAPYLPPEALRAKEGRGIRNEPAYLPEIAKLVAAVKSLKLEEITETTGKTAEEFFSLL